MNLPDIVAQLNPKNGFVHPVYFEAYMDSNGQLDYGVVGRICGQRFNQKSLNSQINKLVGAASFVPDPNIEVPLMTFEQFQEVYEFGKCPHIRDYIVEVYTSTGTLLTKENLFNWVIELD